MKNPLTLSPEIFLTGKYLVLDFETDNHDFGTALNLDNGLVFTGIYDGTYRGWYGDEFSQKELVNSIQSVDFIVGHNLKFEYQWLKRIGVDLHEVVGWDTMLAEKVLAGNLIVPLGLDVCCNRRGLPNKHLVGNALVHGGVSPRDIPTSILRDYCMQDVDSTRGLFLSQIRDFREDVSLLKVLWTKCLLAPVLADIEFNGLRVDKEKVEKEYVQQSNTLAICDSRITESCGVLNLNSPNQVAELLYGKLGFEEPKDFRGNPIRTKTGKRTASSKYIDKLRPRTKEQQEFLHMYKERNLSEARLSKCLTTLRSGPDILHAELHQVRTATGRLSSTGRDSGLGRIQFQNIPREYKGLFQAPTRDYLIGEADASQLEFRAAAELSGDKQALEDIENEIDIHALTSNILGVSRQKAKEHTFKPLYGGVSGTKKEREYYDAFRKRYAGIYACQKSWLREVVETKELRTAWGFKFHFPNAKVTPSGYVTETASVFNYPIQGFATAEIIPIALRYFWDEVYYKGLGMRVLNTVHDSIIAEIPPQEEEIFRQLVVECMTYKVYEYIEKIYGMTMHVPLGVTCKIGHHWGEGAEDKFPLVHNRR